MKLKNSNIITPIILITITIILFFLLIKFDYITLTKTQKYSSKNEASNNNLSLLSIITNPQIETNEKILLNQLEITKNEYLDYYIVYPQFLYLKNKNNQANLNTAIEERSEEMIESLAIYIKNHPDEYISYDYLYSKLSNTTEFKDYYINDKVASIIFNFYEYTGGVHGMGYTKIFNYDFDLDKEIKLEDIFKKNSNYLHELSTRAYKEYTRLNNIQGIEDWVKRGLEPTEENFSLFSFDEYGITFYFSPYQIDSFAAGEKEIFFSYSDLDDILRDKYIFTAL